MNRAIYFAAALLLACVSVEASFDRGLLACNPRTQKRCGGKCVSFLTDERNCGDCGKRCGATFQCIGGGCKCPASRPQECGTPAKCVSVKKELRRVRPRVPLWRLRRRRVHPHRPLQGQPEALCRPLRQLPGRPRQLWQLREALQQRFGVCQRRLLLPQEQA